MTGHPLHHAPTGTEVAEPTGHGGRGHQHVAVSAATDRRWLGAALAVILGFMACEVVVGLAVGSLALLADAGHMLTDAAALVLALVASRIAQRPARGSYTYGFTRIDAVSAQANGITLVLFAAWFCYQAVRRLVSPPSVDGGPLLAVAVVGIVVNVLAVLLASRANRASLNVRGAVSHITTDLWAFVATAVAGLVIIASGWVRADAVASLAVAALMIVSGSRLVRAAGRIFLEAAPDGLDPRVVGADMASVPGVVEVHDLHVWDLGGSEPALSAHVVVGAEHDCHEVAEEVRRILAGDHGIAHATLQADHHHAGAATAPDACPVASHGPGYPGVAGALLPIPALNPAPPETASTVAEGSPSER
jgi:cobalt-zinc-cadmium efflux system protein